MYKRLFLCFFILLTCSYSWALDIGESIQVHGFASQGFLSSTQNNFMGNDTKSGSTEFRDIGLNLNWAASDHLRLGGQLYMREFGDYSEDDVQIDWALIDFRPIDQLGVKIGKIKLPFGLYNEQRDTDFLRSMIFLPQSIYDETRRDIYLAYVGMGLYGNAPIKDWGDLDYHLFYGKTDFPDESIQMHKTDLGMISAINRNNNLPPQKQNNSIPSTFESTERKTDKLYGLALTFNFSEIDLKIGASWMSSATGIYLNDNPEPSGSNVVNSHFVFSAEYILQDWMLTAEYAEKDRTTHMFGKKSLDGPTQSWYLMLSYSPFEKWTFTGLYDEFYQLKHDKNGSTRPQSPDHSAWRKDAVFSIRYDINTYFTIKAEYHWINGTAMQLTVFNSEGTKQYWEYFTTKVSFNF